MVDRMDAGLEGLHSYDCWEVDPENSDHDMCREIVEAVLKGLDRYAETEK